MSAASMELSAARMLAIEVARIPPLDWQREPVLVEQARRGDAKAREVLMLSCQRYILAKARSLVQHYQATGRPCRLEVLDVFQAGNMGMLRYLDNALAGRIPRELMRRYALSAMLNYCVENLGIIRVPNASFRGGKRAPEVVSLDAPLVDGEERFALVDILSS